MAIGKKIAEKELGTKPAKLLRKEAREKAKERVWNPEEEDILVKEGGLHVNLYQLWKRHPAAVGVITVTIIVLLLMRRSRKG